ncbi:MAG: hypothetical protein FJX53_11665 [Alphaproteobacteria bacterium]|nr:hypothetical protein [Alphaproteobacteria bacterium]
MRSRSRAWVESRSVQPLISLTAPTPVRAACSTDWISVDACEVLPAAFWMPSAISRVVTLC